MMTKDIAKRPQGAANNSCVDVDATIPCQGHARQQEADELRARVAELEALCGEIYQVAGALGARPSSWTLCMPRQAAIRCRGCR